MGPVGVQLIRLLTERGLKNVRPVGGDKCAGHQVSMASAMLPNALLAVHSPPSRKRVAWLKVGVTMPWKQPVDAGEDRKRGVVKMERPKAKDGVPACART